MKKNQSLQARAELLSPAGTMRCLRAAVNSGADAVYVGGKRWSARASAGNFEEWEMKEAVDYCHLRNVKLYVTINTLLMDEELEEALEYAAYLYEIGVDALIVQDLGFAACIREAMPDFPLHLSTQGTVYSKEGALAAAALGFERVVLARETTLAEIREIRQALNEGGMETELEGFVHGALCLCYSGQCQMSRFHGGRSGNRGACAQPCRLAYADASGKTSYRLSPKDLCTVDFLGELVEAGIFSLKIEGRMKSPEYVAVVTAIYRKYLDRCLRDGFYTVEEEDRRALRQIFNRGGGTEGYLHGNPGESLMSGALPKHQGIRIGEVVRRGKGELVEVRIFPGETLCLGDGVEIRSDGLPGNVVTYREEIPDRRGHLLIGDIRGKLHRGAELYKITDKQQMQNAEKAYSLDRDGRERTVRRSGIGMRFTAAAGEYPTLSVWEIEPGVSGRTLSVTVQSEVPAETAHSRPLSETRVQQQLSKTGDSVFTAETVEVGLSGDAVLPMAVINAMRRDALEKLAEEKCRVSRRAPQREKVREKEFVDGAQGCGPEPLPGVFLYVHDFRDGTLRELTKAAGLARSRAGEQNFTLLLPAKIYLEKERDGSLADILAVLPGESRAAAYISQVSKGEEDRYLRRHFEELVLLLKEKERENPDPENALSIVAGNIGWLMKFAASGVRGTAAGFGCNALNRKTKEMLTESAGARQVLPSLETAGTGKAGEIRQDGFFGAVPLMVTEHLFPEECFWDARDGERKRYFSLINAYGDKSLILRDGPFRTVMGFRESVFSGFLLL